MNLPKFFVKGDQLVFECGCTFTITGEQKENSPIPPIKFNPDIRDKDHDINFVCEKTYELLSRGLTKGVFQLETPLGRQWSKKLKPENMEHIAALGSVLRPGCLESVLDDGVNMTGHFCKRKNNEEEAVPFHDAIADILSPSYQIIIYQESILKIAQKVAGFDLQEADSLRKAIGKKKPEDMAKAKKLFMEKGKEVGLLTEEQLEQLFEWIEKSQRYIFNKCLSGNTLLLSGGIRNGSKYRWTLEEAYNIRNNIEYAKKTGHLDLYKRWKLRKNFGKSWSLNEDGRLRPNTILDIQPDSIQNVFRITLENGKSIDASTHHKFPTPNGEKETCELSINDCLYIRDYYDTTPVKKYNWSNFSKEDRKNHKKLHDHQTVGFMSGLNNHSYTNGEYTKYINNIQLLPQECAHCGKIKKRMEVHHKNRDRTNNSLDNLERLCVSCHKKADYALGRRKRGEKGYSISPQKIISIESLGEQQTYNVTMAAPYHTFTTDQGIVTCNSHAVGYGVTCYITAFIKTHFPLAFYRKWLEFAKEKQDPLEEISGLVNDAKIFDIEVLPPDISFMSRNFHTDGKTIYFGLTDIKGVGDSQFEKLQNRVKEMEFDWSSWFEFLVIFGNSISSTVMERLILTGSLRKFGVDRQRMLYEYNKWQELSKGEKEWMFLNRYKFTNLNEAFRAAACTKNSGGACHAKKRVDVLKSLSQLLDNPPQSNNDTVDMLLFHEEEFLGIALTCNNLDQYDNAVANCTCRDLLKGKQGYSVVGVEIKRVNEVKTKKGKNPGQPMGFLSVMDESGELDSVVVFPQVWEQYKHLIQPGNFVLMRGKMSEQDSFQVEVVYSMEKS